MYKNFFGLRENPFNANPDPRFLHLSPQTQRALDELTHGIQNRKGLILLTGEVGTGKTTLINYLLDWLRRRKMPTAFIFNSHLSTKHLFDFILNDFGIPTDFKLKSNMLLHLNQWLIQRFRAGHTPVLIVDEAQGLSLELLEEIRLLLNLETASEKLLQIVLAGQPELEDKLKRPQMRQLRQRISLRCTTSPLTLAEAHRYIADRLRIAGAERGSVFTSESVKAAHFYSRGIPRVMNLLCEHALINAYVEQLNPVPPRMVEEAAREFLMDEFRPVTGLADEMLHLDDDLNCATPESAGAPHRSFPAQATDSRQDSEVHNEVHTFASPLAFVEEKSAADVECKTAASVLECPQRGTPEELVDASFSVLHLVPASSQLPSRQKERAPAANSSPSQSECAAELVATMERMLAAASAPRPRLEVPESTHELPVAPMREQAPTSPSRLFPVDSVNPNPQGSASAGNRRSSPWLEAWKRAPGPPLWLATVTAWWPWVSAAILPKGRKSLAAARALLRRWKCEFKRDWIALTNAMHSHRWKNLSSTPANAGGVPELSPSPPALSEVEE